MTERKLMAEIKDARLGELVRKLPVDCKLGRCSFGWYVCNYEGVGKGWGREDYGTTPEAALERFLFKKKEAS